MVNRSFLVIGVVLSQQLGWGEQAWARDPSCEYMSASLVTVNTLYGIGLGSVIGGLAIVAAESDDDVERKLATSALIGSGLGFGFGVYEVVTRDCRLVISESPPTPDYWPRLSYQPSEAGWQVSWQLNF